MDLINQLPAYRKPKVFGATWNKKKNKWIAQIQINGKNIHLGNFDTAEEAQATYMAAGGRERLERRVALYESLMVEILRFERSNPNSRCVPVGSRNFAIIDRDDFDNISKWKWKFKSYLGGKYACRLIRREGKISYIQMHREILNAPDHLDVDHRDGNGLDNRRSNIRLATCSQNMCNRGKEHGNSSGFKGVSWDKRQSKWFAQIRFQGKQYNIGLFSTPEEGHAAYREFADRLHGEFAHY